MAEGHRHLAAIMFTDMVGFTALSQRDEATAIRLLEEHRSLLGPLFALHGGRMIKTMGDGILAEFASVVESVHCAQEIQRTLTERNSAAGTGQKIELRVGIHVGEVLEQDGDILGDAVNVASRLEPLAEPGGICVSEQVIDQIRNKLPVTWENLVAPPLKNVSQPIRAYRLRDSADSGTSPELPAERSSYVRLAVLPFTCMSPDPADQCFADGLTEEMITHLSRGTALHVVARTSVMQYKGAQRGIRDIGRELSVGSVLEGSVRRSVNKVRIAVQLIDSASEEHLWVDRFDRELNDVFAVQDEICRSVTKVLQGKLVRRIPPAFRNRQTQFSPYREGARGRGPIEAPAQN
jgi:adenylate cyclase